ncbi:hypothetical protein [Sulfitobacter sp. MF3-043]|uniref:hypothetical protein n=1 Tax=Sulfitobacter sediminivivens TaxID=3252902 RepID=UPI0036D823B8
MSMTVTTMLALLAVWMLVCAWCGYRIRVIAFLGLLLLGIGLNMAWIVFGLKAAPFEAHALMAQAALAMYGIGTFGIGFLVGRLARQFRASRVE